MVAASCASAWIMLLWPMFQAHRLGSCSCGLGFGSVGLDHVAVVEISDDPVGYNCTVAQVSGALAWIMFVWLMFRWHRL